MINCGLGVWEYTVCIYDDGTKCIKFGTLFHLRMADSFSSTKLIDAPFFLQAAYLLPIRFLNRPARRLGSRSSHHSSSSLNSSSRTASCKPTAEPNTNATSMIKPLQVVHRTVLLFATTANRFLLDSWNIIA